VPVRVLIEGSGVAATCCAALLRAQGIKAFRRERTSAGSGPVLLLNSQTQRLLADVFGDPANLFVGCPIIRKRVVLWKPGAEVAEFAHDGIVADEGLLLQRLSQRAEADHLPFPEDQTPDYFIHAAPDSDRSPVMHFGTRIATAGHVRLLPSAEAGACWVEALPEGWLFLLPRGDGDASLISVGAPARDLLESSRLVVDQLESFAPASREFAAYPKIAEHLIGPSWLSCGNAAIAFDPICGEGVGHAVRESILACAALQRVAESNEDEAPLEYYASRLLIGFLRHLETCRTFYTLASQGSWWMTELSHIERGIVWTQNRIASLPGPRYRLSGFKLQPYEQPNELRGSRSEQ
jgi:hypothetical protein